MYLSASEVAVSTMGRYNKCSTYTFTYYQSSSRRLENIGEDIPTIPEVIGAHTLNFMQKFKFLQLFLEGGGASPLVYANKPWSLVNL